MLFAGGSKHICSVVLVASLGVRTRVSQRIPTDGSAVVDQAAAVDEVSVSSEPRRCLYLPSGELA
jgi:hypothetical protein